MNRSSIIAAAFVALSAATAACSGGGGSSSIASLTPNHVNTAALTGTAVLTIPNRAATATASTRSAQYVSPSVASIGIAVNGATPAFSNVASGSSLCTTSAGGRTCTIPLSAPPGSDTFVVTLYDGANGSGTNLGSSTVVQTIVAGTPFTLAFTVSGIVASIVITVPAIDAGPTSVPVAVAAKDADGNTIIGSAAYATPITLTNSDTTGTLKLSTTTVAAPTTAVTLAYTGGALASAAQIGATSTGVATSAITSASVMPLNYYPTGITNTYAYSSNDNTTTYVGGAPQSTYPPDPLTGSYPETISSGATFNGQTGLTEVSQGQGGLSPTTSYGELANGAIVGVGYTEATTTTFPPAVSLGLPYGCSGVTYTSSSTTTYTPPSIFALLPFSTATTNTATASTENSTYTTAPGNTAFCTTLPPAAFTDTSTATTGVDGSYHETDAYTDGSGYTIQDNADGSGAVIYTPGTSLATGMTAWENGMPATWTAASLTVSAPSGGTITISVSQTISGSTQTSSVAVPVADMYPGGLPTSLQASTSTAGSAVSAPPSPCAVTASYHGPVVPVTTVTSVWYPVLGLATTATATDYLAPAVGSICEVLTEQEQESSISGNTPLTTIANGAPLPVDDFNTAIVDDYSETDSLSASEAGTASIVRVQSSSARPLLTGRPFRDRFGLLPRMHF